MPTTTGGGPGAGAEVPAAAARERAARIDACLRDAAAAVLRLDPARLPADRSLLALGLDSLAAAELASAVESALGVPVPLSDLLAGPSLIELGESLGRQLAAAAAPARPLPALAGPPPARYPLSWGQRAIWLLDRLAPGNPAYVIAGAGRIAGVAAPRLRRALAALVERHAALRTTFELEGEEVVQVVHDRPAFAFREEDATGWSDARLEEGLTEEAYRPFDLVRGPLLRVGLFRREPAGAVAQPVAAPAGGRPAGEHLVVLAVHHIVADFGSLGVLLGELGAVLRGQPLAPSTLTYRDFVRQERERLAGARGEELRAFWRAALPPGRPPLELPTDRPRPPVQTFRGGARGVRLDRAMTACLAAAGRDAGATPFMTFLAVFLVLLHRHSHQEELLVGTPAARRGSPRQAGLIGYLVNPVAVRGDLAGDPTFVELLGRVRDTVIAALGHQDYPFPLVAEQLAAERDASRSPVFQAMFTFHSEARDGERGLGGLALGEAGARFDLGGLTLESVRLPRRAAQLDLTLLMAEIGGGLAASLQFNSDLFDAVTAQRLLGQLRSLVAALGTTVERRAAHRLPISRLPLLSAAERHQLRLEWNDSAGPAAPGRLSPTAVRVEELFEWQAARQPRQVATAGQGMALTYGDLEAQANRLAHYLRRLGVGPETRVGLCVERSPRMVVALLGILKAGSAYVPLDPSDPAERLALVLADSAVEVLLTEERWLERLGGADGGGARHVVCLDRDAGRIAAEAASRLPAAAVLDSAESLAYLIYTSGSTGRPKGVALPHRAVVSFLRAMAERPGLAGGDVLAAVTTLGFDIAGLEIHLPLAVGGRVEVVDREEGVAGQRLAARLAAAGATAMQATPATWRLLLEAGWTAPLPRTRGEGRGADGPATERRAFLALCGGEALPRDLAAELAARGVELWNMYGPTETAIWSSTCRFTAAAAAGGVVDLGRPIANTCFHVVDPRCERVPLGAAGELLIGGAGVARGYWRRPDLTAERFVPDPWSDRRGARLYRTGDLVRHRAGGELAFLGRIDTQVKVRGYRIELGEIEAALLRHAAVAAAVVAVHGTGTDRRLVAYLVPHRDRSAVAAATLGPSELRDLLRRTLPEYMLPADFVVLDRLPIAPSGKVDRRALPSPVPARAGGPAAVDGCAGHGRTAPRTPAEALVAKVWAEVLDLPPPAPAPGAGGGGSRFAVAVDDDFFRLGGHSLLAVRVAARLSDSLGVELPLSRLLQLPRLEDLAREVKSLAGSGRSRAASRAPASAPPLRPVPRHGPLPLSFAQERMWFLYQLDPGSPVFNIAGGARFAGTLALPIWSATLAALVRRHEALRTTFLTEAGRPMQVIAPGRAAPAPAPLEVDLRRLPPERRAAELIRVGEALGRRPFDLAAGPLLRAAVVRVAGGGSGGADEAVYLVLHHLIADGWSLTVLLGEMAALYEAALHGRAAAQPPLPVQAVDHAVWQRQWLQGETLERELSYWRDQLAGEPPGLALSGDRPRAASPSTRGASRPCVLPPVVAGALAELARQRGATVFMTVLAGFAAVLGRHSRQDEIWIGGPVLNRGRAELARVVGLLANTLVLRVGLAGDPPAGELLEQVRDTALAAYAHQDLPFEKLVAELAPRRGGGSHLFEALLAVDTVPLMPRLGEVPLQPLAVERGATLFDLALLLAARDGCLTGTVEYRRALFDAPMVDRLASHLVTLLAALAAAPGARLSELPLLAAAERHQLLREWRGALAAFPEDRLLHELFEEQAARHPEAVALVAGGSVLTYGALDARADRLARHLQSLGVAAEEPVGLYLERSFDLVVGMLAILKAGGAYVPLDPAYPQERLSFLLADSAAAIVVTERKLLAGLPATVGGRTLCSVAIDHPGLRPGAAEPVARGKAAPQGAACPARLAYVIYTSGSTGLPKGVLISHRNVTRLLAAAAPHFRFGPRDAWTLFHSFAFDLAVWETWGPLTTGGRLVVVPYETSRSPADFHALLIRERITVLNQTPAGFRQLAQVATAVPRGHEIELAALRLLILCGEALEVASLAPWLARFGDERPRLVNMYGITETTVHVTVRRLGTRDLQDAGRSPIGAPLADLTLYLLDPAGAVTPRGAVGEVHVGGPGLARGYLRRPDLTALRFVPDPFATEPGARLYRTGDLARHRATGDLDYVGRADSQVKVRGVRVEPGEVEAVLASHPAVAEAVVVARHDAAGERVLVAYVVRRDGGEGTAELRRHLKDRLPEAFLPSTCVVLPSLPRTAHGKIDRRSLPEPAAVRPDLGRPATPPRTPLEAELAEVWCSLLGRSEVGVEDSFFDLGGHSLLFMQLASQVRERFGVEVPLHVLFDAPTIEQLTVAMAASGLTGVAPDEADRLLREIAALSPAEAAAQLSAESAPRDVAPEPEEAAR
jgi:amino acid adenylation domain-containing protein